MGLVMWLCRCCMRRLSFEGLVGGGGPRRGVGNGNFNTFLSAEGAEGRGEHLLSTK